MINESPDPKTKRSLPVLLPEKGFLRPLIRIFYSVKNFVKASVLSLLVLLTIFFLLSQMEQAYTMFLRMIEFGKISLLLCFLVVNLLAIGLSHFPIYTYYAGNLNGSRKYVNWRKDNPYPFSFFKRINIYTFEPIFHPNYVKDIYSNILRQYLGLTLFLIWFHFIFSTFEPNLKFTVNNLGLIKAIAYGATAIPFIIYWALKRKLNRFHSTLEERRRILKSLGRLFVLTSIISLILLGVVMFNDHLFSQGGLLVLLLTTYFMMLSFTFFRLVRPRLSLIIKYLKKQSGSFFSNALKLVKPLESSTNYLIVFQVGFFLSFLSIVYFNLASIYDWILPNGIAIVLIYLFSFFFIISSIGKYYFVKFSLAKKDKDNQQPLSDINSGLFKLLTTAIVVLIGLFVISFFTESTLNELTIHPINSTDDKQHQSVPIEQRVESMSDTIYFVSSHGGGLKANTWTLLVLNNIQKQTKGHFINNCMSFSGASGGSLGLALYGNLYGIHGNDFEAISKK